MNLATGSPSFPRLYPILDTRTAAAHQCNRVTVARAWIGAGIQILQYRHKDSTSQAWTREIWNEADAIGNLCDDAGVTFIINDRADAAKLLNAGLHLGQEDLTPSDARHLLGDTSMLGFSTHNAVQLAAATQEPADYIALGPIFGTASKENADPIVGLENLGAWRDLAARPQITPRPLIAIGGITRSNAADVLAAGADSVAVIGDLFPELCNGLNLRNRMDEWHKLTQA